MMFPRFSQPHDYELDPLGVVALSTRQTFERLAFWARAAVWRFVFSLPIVTYPAATAAFYYTVREGLRDPSGSRVDLRRTFRFGFRTFFVKSLLLTLLNLGMLAMIFFAITFWATQESWLFLSLAAIAGYFLLFWWICQPLIVPLMVEYPASSALDVVRQAVRVVAMHPLYSFLLALLTSMFHFIGLLLLGPGTLIVAPLVALLTIQGLWIMTGKAIPDLLPPGAYPDNPERRDYSQQENQADSTRQ